MAKKQERAERTEADLTARIVAGDDHAFDWLYEHYYERVRAFALRRVSDAHDAEDITQEVFLQIHRSIGSFQGRSRLSTWIFGIAHNVTCRFYRKQRGPRVPLDQIDVEVQLSYRPSAERRLDAARALERCDRTLHRTRDDEHQRIFELFYGGGHPLRAIASTLGCPTDKVKHSLRRSRDAMLRDVPDLRSTLLSLVA